MTTEFFSSSCSNGLQVFHSQPWLMTDILAACQNYKTVQGEKKRKDKRWGWRAGKERKRKHGSHSMLRLSIFVSPEVNASVRNQRFEKLFSPSKLEGEPSACQDGALLKGSRPGPIWVTPELEPAHPASEVLAWCMCLPARIRLWAQPFNVLSP